MRLIVLSDDDQVLLFEDSDPGLPGVSWWITPGGGMDPGETERITGVRELAEETGWQAAISDLHGPVARRRVIHGLSDIILDQDETFYLVNTPRFTVDISGHTPKEQLTLRGHRWWPRSELAETDATIWPSTLLEMINTGQHGEGVVDLGTDLSESTLPPPPSAQ